MKNKYWKLLVSLDGEEFGEEFGSFDLSEVIEELQEWQDSENHDGPKTYKNEVNYRIESSQPKE